MKTISKDTQNMCMKSLQSTFHKLASAYDSMMKKGANTTLVKKRKDAVKIGLDSLKNVWADSEFFYSEENILTSIDVLQTFIPSIEKQIEKAKDGSSQKTLNVRRLKALKLAIQSLEERLM